MGSVFSSEERQGFAPVKYELRQNVRNEWFFGGEPMNELSKSVLKQFEVSHHQKTPQRLSWTYPVWKRKPSKSIMSDSSHYVGELRETYEKLTFYQESETFSELQEDGDVRIWVPHGKGTCTWSSGASFTGEWDNGNMTKGILKYADHGFFNGTFEFGMETQGTIHTKSCKYTGLIHCDGKISRKNRRLIFGKLGTCPNSKRLTRDFNKIYRAQK